jgi:hypothetical protein
MHGLSTVHPARCLLGIVASAPKKTKAMKEMSAHSGSVGTVEPVPLS